MTSLGCRLTGGRRFACPALLAALLCVPLCAEVNEVRIPTGAGGVGFLALLVSFHDQQRQERDRLIEKHAQASGIPNLHVRWIEIGGPAVMNDALLSGSADFISAGPPAFLTLWAADSRPARRKRPGNSAVT